MSNAQTDNGTAALAQSKEPATIPNTEAYSSNFYFDIEASEGQVFSAQMTVRGGVNGADHLDRVLGAMRYVLKRGGSAQRRGKHADGPAPAATNGQKWEWTKGAKGRSELVLRGDQAEPDAVPCPVHEGKTLKRSG